MPERARRRRKIDTGGPWGTGFFILSLGFIGIGIGYLARHNHDVPEALQALTIPRTVWACAWIVCGLYGCWKAFTPPQQHRQVWPFAGLTCLWSGAYLIHWAFTWDTSWTGALVWGCFAALILIWGGRLVNPLPKQGS